MPVPLRASSAGAFSISRWSHASAALGAVLWIAAPFAPVGTALSFGAMEHVFLFILKFLGVPAMVLGTMALALVSATVAVEIRSRAPRVLLLSSAASIAAGMGVAGVCGVGELTARGWIGIPRMVAIHGLLNAVGFTPCGLLGHLHLRLATGRS